MGETGRTAAMLFWELPNFFCRAIQESQFFDSKSLLRFFHIMATNMRGLTVFISDLRNCKSA